MTKPTIIYIIDDDPDDQDILIEAFKEIDSSIECFTALNGQEGFKKLETKAIPFPTLIFLDLNMPRFNGRRFLLELKNDHYLKSIPVIIYTTSSNPKDMVEMNQLGALDYVIKQFDFAILKEKLKTILSIVSSV